MSSPPRLICANYTVGAPGAGKGTICTHLAETYHLAHYSVGDNLRAWMRQNPSTALAADIRSKLDNQGFLTSETLNPFIYRAILDVANDDKSGVKGILIDGYPRCLEQLESFGSWPFEEISPLVSGKEMRPDIVLSLEVTEQNAKDRYLSRSRDANDSEDKFQRRFAEYERETRPAEEVYRQSGVLISVDVNGTKAENNDTLTKKLQESQLWREVIEERTRGVQFLV
ncbi:adenylate kinase [Fusarium albosuccineum]|uniref:Adenylate kinase n=1 Tax=Fusarium albosuccineum TaxID=1237068 RepID=A0A8H4KL28_9HYPO|nr:adenylate kinase [Fusarium albosuccineum]